VKVSVVTPSFRQLEWLQLCIASIADQQGVEVEHIVQDAGTPGFAEFSREMERKWPNRSGYSRHMVSEPDEGMYDAVNRGLLKAKGKILAYLNCDEQYLAGTLGRVVHWFDKNPKLEVLFGDAIIVDKAGDYLCSRRATVPQPLHTLTSGNLSIFTSSTFFRRSLRDRGFLFEKKWRVVGDAVWAVRLRREGVPCRSWRHPLAVFTETGQNLSLPETARKEQEFLCQEAPPWARLLAPWLLAWYRLRRWWAGAYRDHRVRYSIYTLKSPARRVEFGPFRSVARWPGRGKA
jgi:glycosyltransferase involved in cell wall biosynthesis